jgi:hypothetical protein
MANRGFVFCVLTLVSSNHQSLSYHFVSIVSPNNNQHVYTPTHTDLASMFLRFRIENLATPANFEINCAASDVVIEFDGIELIRDSVEIGNFSYDDITMAGLGKHSFRVSLLDSQGSNCISAVSHLRVVEARLQVSMMATDLLSCHEFLLSCICYASSSMPHGVPFDASHS